MELVRRITEAVAQREDASYGELPPLYDIVDPEALQELIESADDDVVTVEVIYHDYVLRIGADGHVDVRESASND